MARWNARERQQMVDSYLNATGHNMFVPREFLAWLEPQEEHPLHSTFFGRSEAELAQAMREAMVRHWAAGLRIAIREEVVGKTDVKVIVHEVPALVSPIAGRKAGGGYAPVGDAETLAELRRQAAGALDAWLRRYGGVASASGVDTAPIGEIAALLAGGVAIAA